MIQAIFISYFTEWRNESVVIEFENAQVISDQEVINIAKKRAPPGAWLSEVTVFDRDYNPKTIVDNKALHEQIINDLISSMSI